MHLVLYDIVDDDTRSKVHSILSRGGDRVQYSVFSIIGGPAKILELKSEIESVVSKTDTVMFVDLGPSSTAENRIEWIGSVRLPDDRDDTAWVV